VPQKRKTSGGTSCRGILQQEKREGSGHTHLDQCAVMKEGFGKRGVKVCWPSKGEGTARNNSRRTVDGRRSKSPGEQQRGGKYRILRRRKSPEKDQEKEDAEPTKKKP